jgi:hypothetical protein
VILVLQEMQRSIRIVLGIEGNIETGLGCARRNSLHSSGLSWVENGGLRHHYIG